MKKLIKTNATDMKKQIVTKKYIKGIIVKRNQINRVFLQGAVKRGYTDIIVLGNQEAPRVVEILAELGIDSFIVDIDEEKVLRSRNSMKRQAASPCRIVIGKARNNRNKTFDTNNVGDGTGGRKGKDGTGVRKAIRARNAEKMPKRK